MSSNTTVKDLLAKSLQKSHSSSSLLLSSANLSWTPPTATAHLVSPQPSLTPNRSITSSPTSAQQLSNEELIQSIRLSADSKSSSRHQSNDNLDNFQTISLLDNRSAVEDNQKPDNGCLNSSKQSLESLGSSETTSSKFSLNDRLFCSQSTSSSTQSSTTSSSGSSFSFVPSIPFLTTSSSAPETSQSLTAESTVQSTDSRVPSYLAPKKLFSLATHTGQSIISSLTSSGSGSTTELSDSTPHPLCPPALSSTAEVLPHQPIVKSLLPAPPPPAPPVEPPKGVVAKDYKLRGPLRLYDPNYGKAHTVSEGSTDPISATLPQQPVPSLVIPPLPLSQSVNTETLYNPYNPTNYYPNNSQTFDVPNDQSLTQAYSPSQQYDNSRTLSDRELVFNCVEMPQNLQQITYISGQTTEQQNQQNFDSNLNQNTYNPNPNQEWIEGSAQMYSQSGPTNNTYPPTTGVQQYEPVVQHWFYQKIVENKEIWKPFSLYDSYNLEQSVLCSANYGYGVVIPTDGGRFDVSVYDRIRRPVYWKEVDTIVRRCSWFYKKEGHNRWAPYPEEFAAKLEDSYRDSVLNNRWNQRIEFEAGSEVVVMHSQQTINHYQMDNSMPDGWGQALENPIRPRLVHRSALDIFDDIDEGEPQQIDHLVFLIHGVGEFCDFSFRSIVEVVDDFRWISLSQMRAHFKEYLVGGQLGRIELLPISWHSALHGEETGIDDRLKLITLSSIPKLRHFSNDTILDALFYTSPVYCQTIADNVVQEINRLFHLFCQRNRNFCGTVALGGHSLGSLIMFDILAHQTSGAEVEPLSHNISQTTSASNITNTSKAQELQRNEDKESVEKTIEFYKQPLNRTTERLLDFLGFPEFCEYFIENLKLNFESIILLTETDIENRLQDLPLGLVKNLQNFIENCQKMNTNNRIELIDNILIENKNSTKNSINYANESLRLGFPAIKYPTLAFKPSAFFAMGSPIPMFLTVRGVHSLSPDYRLPTCPAVYNIFHPYDPIAYRWEPMIDRSFKDIKPVLIPHHKGRKRMHLELRDSITRMGSDLKNKIYDSLRYTWNSIHEFARAHKSSGGEDTDSYQSTNTSNQYNNPNDVLIDEELDNSCDNLSAGALNSGRRIDYVLQESPVEAFNEYLFAMAAHACYWQSEDTALLILRELYGQLGYFTSPVTQTQAINTSVSADSLTASDGQQVSSDQQIFHLS